MSKKPNEYWKQFREISIYVPASFKWRATDADGTSMVFRKKPIFSSKDGVWYCRKGGYIEVGKGPLPKHPELTLYRLGPARKLE